MNPRLYGSDGEMNFGDHSKIVLWDEGRAVRYVDKRGEVHIWAVGEGVGISCLTIKLEQ